MWLCIYSIHNHIHTHVYTYICIHNVYILVHMIQEIPRLMVLCNDRR